MDYDYINVDFPGNSGFSMGLDITVKNGDSKKRRLCQRRLKNRRIIAMSKEKMETGGGSSAIIY